MISLARSSLIYEWRRYLAAVLAVTFSGLLVLVQIALLLGLFGTVSALIDHSDAELWIGFRNTQSVDLGRAIPPNADLNARLHPAVGKVERLHMTYAEWRRADGIAVTAVVHSIDPRHEGLAFAKILTPGDRKKLDEPDAVLIDEADRRKLGAVEGGLVEINGRRARVAGIVNGIRAIGGVNVLASYATGRRLDPSQGATSDTTYYLVKLTRNANSGEVASAIGDQGPIKRYSVWQSEDFSIQSQLYWLLESGAGTGAGVAALLGLIVGVVITSQTLAAAILASLKEFAALRALGVSRRSLRNVVLEQAFWIGAIGLALTYAMTGLVAWVAAHYQIAMSFPWWLTSGTGALVFGIAFGSGLYALRPLFRADPATLLR